MPVTIPGSLAILDAVIGRLKATPALTAVVGSRIFSFVPAATLYPYIQVSNVEARPWHGFGVRGQLVTLDVHVFSQYNGPAEVDAIADLVVRVLDHEPLTIAGFGQPIVKHEQTLETATDLVGGIITRGRVVEIRILARQRP